MLSIIILGGSIIVLIVGLKCLISFKRKEVFSTPIPFKRDPSLPLNVSFKKLSRDAILPRKAYPGDSCFDVFATESVVIAGRSQREVNLGLAVDLPPDWEMTLRTRSSFGRKGLQVHMGTIDSGYRGYLSVFIYNHTDSAYIIQKGDKIAQLAFNPIYPIVVSWTDSLSTTERGDKGFGSSGK